MYNSDLLATVCIRSEQRSGEHLLGRRAAVSWCSQRQREQLHLFEWPHQHACFFAVAARCPILHQVRNYRQEASSIVFLILRHPQPTPHPHPPYYIIMSDMMAAILPNAMLHTAFQSMYVQCPTVPAIIIYFQQEFSELTHPEMEEPRHHGHAGLRQALVVIL